MCRKPQVSVELVPNIGTEVEITSAEMKHALSVCPIVFEDIKLDDNIFFTPMWDGWCKIIEYLKTKVPEYYVEKFDCDNMADFFKVKVAEVFKINTCARVDGWVWVPAGYTAVQRRHAWNIFYEPEYGTFFQLEPQTGEVMDLDDVKYQPKEIVMG